MVFGRDELKNASSGQTDSPADSGSYEKYSLEDLFKDDDSSSASSDHTMVFSKEKITDEFGSEEPVMEDRKTDASRAASNEPDTSWLKDAPDESAVQTPKDADHSVEKEKPLSWIRTIFSRNLTNISKQQNNIFIIHQRMK